MVTKGFINLRSLISASPEQKHADSTFICTTNSKIYLSTTNRQTYGWTKLPTSILIVSQTERGGRNKGRSWQDKRGVGVGVRRLLKFLSGCFCPRRVFKAGKGSLHRKMPLGMLTVTLHSLWGRHRHLDAQGDSCHHFICAMHCFWAQHKDSEMISEWDLVELNFLAPRHFYVGSKMTPHLSLAIEDYFIPDVDLSDVLNNNLISIELQIITKRKSKIIVLFSSFNRARQVYFYEYLSPMWRRNNYIGG